MYAVKFMCNEASPRRRSSQKNVFPLPSVRHGNIDGVEPAHPEPFRSKLRMARGQISISKVLNYG